MAFTVTTIIAGTTLFIADVIADADADAASPNIPHGLGALPLDFSLVPLLQGPAALSQWALTTADATNLVVTKGTAVGSGNAAAQVRVIARLPHSLVR